MAVAWGAEGSVEFVCGSAPYARIYVLGSATVKHEG